MNRCRGSIKASIFVLLFALPFAAVGVGMTIWLWREVLLSRTVLQSWTVVPAVVDKAELKSHRGSKGSTTYEAKTTYHYDFAGRSYTGERIGLFSGGDNIGDFQQSVYRQLRQAKDRGRTVDCYVNPDDPSRAVLRPQWRPEMTLFKAVFGLMFGAAGLALLIGGVLSVVIEGKEKRLKNRYPTEPWLWRAGWHTPVLRSGLIKRAITAATVLFWVNLVTLPLWASLIPGWQRDGGFKWAVSIMLLLVVVISGFCVRTILRARKYGAARLEFDRLPLRPGEPVGARLYVPQTLPMGAELHMSLKCVHKVTTGRNKQRTTTSTSVWNHDHSVRGLIGPFEPIEFRCQLPQSAPSTDLDKPDNHHDWTFTAEADVPGVDLHAEFAVPVFAKSPSDGRVS